MKLIAHFVLCASTTLLLWGCSDTKEKTNNPPRSVVEFNDSWSFSKDTTRQNAWKKVQIPHTMNTEPLVVNDMWQGTGWYKKTFKITSLEGKKSFLNFEGVMHEADVWINGQFLAHHMGGYLPFSVDITSAVNTNADNVVLVRVNNEDNPTIPPGKKLDVLDFNYYGGIYRDVKLLTVNDVYITDAVHANKTGSGGVLIHFTEITPETATGLVQVHVKNDAETPVKFQTKTSINNSTFESELMELPSKADTTIISSISVPNPSLWSPTDPNLYEVAISLISENKVIDSLSMKTGIRKIELTEEGFFVNGERSFIRGTNRHQEYPYLGYAISDNAQYRDAIKIKNAGFDLVRLSHYPQDESFLDACDELGLIVMNCIPGWQFYEAGAFEQNSFKDIRDMIRRDRNHPSVFFWEVSLNESWMKGDYIKIANQILDEELPFEDVYSVGWTDDENYDIFIPARQHGKAPDYWNFYKDGKRKIFIAEYGDWEYYAHNAGFNQKAFADLTEDERTSRQLRGQGEKRLLQQALNFQEAANSNRKARKFIFGSG